MNYNKRHVDYENRESIDKKMRLEDQLDMSLINAKSMNNENDFYTCECVECDIPFQTIIQYYDHMLHTHKNNQFRKFIQENQYDSDESLLSKDYLHTHEKNDWSVRDIDERSCPLICECIICDVGFYSQIQYQRHMITIHRDHRYEKILTKKHDKRDLTNGFDASMRKSSVRQNMLVSKNNNALISVIEDICPELDELLNEENKRLLLTSSEEDNSEDCNEIDIENKEQEEDNTNEATESNNNEDEFTEFECYEEEWNDPSCDDIDRLDDYETGPSQEEIELLVSQFNIDHMFHMELDLLGWPTIVNGNLGSEHVVCKAIYECNYCDHFSTESLNSLREHIIQHQIGTSHQMETGSRQACVICSCIVPVKDIRTHMSKHIEHICCCLCMQMVSRETIEDHKNEHSKHFICGLCGDLYKSKAAICKHLTHHKKMQYPCEECPLMFASMEKLVRHVSGKHMSIDCEYADCPYCHELTQDIKNHLYSVDTCKYKCKICKKTEKTLELFMDHMNTHAIVERKVRSLVYNTSTRKYFDCPDCHMRLSDWHKLDVHKHCHDVDKLYKDHIKRQERAHCEVCDTTMPKIYLRMHTKRHSISTRCAICHKFVPTASIDQHTAIHASDHVCDLCGHRYRDKRSMEHHRWSHGRVMSRPCTDCPLQFRSEMHRVRHISSVHKRVDPEFVECYFCLELLQSKIEYHLFDHNYCLRRCKLCNDRFKTSTDLLAHVTDVHRNLIALIYTHIDSNTHV